MKNITVIGAGTMGNGIAHVFAQFGFKTHLVDIDEDALEKAIATIEKNLDRQLRKEKITEDIKQQTLQNLNTTSVLETAVAQADLVVEAASEDLNVKLAIFKQLDELCPSHTVLASNTSSISITQIAAATQRPDRVIGMHFMNPVPVMQLVEIINGYSTDPTVTDKISKLAVALQKRPVTVNDYPGFVANRILMPMINEAIESLYHGVAGVTEIDTVMQLGMAHPMGPLKLADFIGLDVCLSILQVMHDGFKNPKYAPCPLLINMVRAKKLGVKSKEGFYDYSESQKSTQVAKQFAR